MDREINFMFLLSFCEIVSANEVNHKFNVRDFDKLQALNWIHYSNVPPARRILSGLASKPEVCKAAVANSTIDSKKYVALNQIGTR